MHPLTILHPLTYILSLQCQVMHPLTIITHPLHVVDKSLLWLVHGICIRIYIHCSEDISHVPAKGGIYLLCILATQNQLLFVEKCIKLIRFCRIVHQINQVLWKSVSTSSVLSWYMGNVHRSVPLMLPSTRIHIIIAVS